MTRDEAIAIICECDNACTARQANDLTSMLVRLGLLTLDESKATPEQRFHAIVLNLHPGLRGPNSILSELDKAGLKIVEADK